MARSNKENFKVITGSGKDKLTAREKLLSLIILGIVAFLLIQLASHWISAWLSLSRVQLEVAEEANIDFVTSAHGIITRHEEAVSSPKSGYVLGKVSEGKRVPVEGEVVKLLTDYPIDEVEEETEEAQTWWQEFYAMIRGWFLDEEEFEEDEGGSEKEELNEADEVDLGDYISLYAPHSGIVSYRVDGWEETIFPEHPYELLNEPVNQVKEEGLGQKDYLREGEAAFKIVDNSEWFYSMELDAEKGRAMRNQENVEITFSFSPELKVDAELVDVEQAEEEKRFFFTYRITRQLPGFSRYRWVDADINYKSYEGIEVPPDAVIEREGKKGVFLEERGAIVFSPVNVIYEGETRCLVEGIAPKSMVVSSPETVEEGQKIE